MITLERCYRLLDSGLSLATLNDKKQANFSWKVNQTTPLTKDEFKTEPTTRLVYFSTRLLLIGSTFLIGNIHPNQLHQEWLT